MQELEQGDRAGTDTTNTSIRDITLPLKHAALGLCPTSCEHQGPFHPIWSQFRELNLPKSSSVHRLKRQTTAERKREGFPSFMIPFRSRTAYARAAPFLRAVAEHPLQASATGSSKPNVTTQARTRTKRHYFKLKMQGNFLKTGIGV